MKKIIVNNPIVDYFLALFRNKDTDTYKSSLFQRRYEGSGRAMEKMRDETEHETSIKHALAMLADGVPCEKVAKYTDLSIEEVRALAEKKSA